MSSSSSSSSKKKSFTGSTMTLRDFHGGSIPSDLPLPSAPGVAARPPDRPHPAPNAWGPSGRPDHRPRPGSAGAASRAIADPPSSFLPHLGRHFDEDERKPFDPSASLTTPRRPLPTASPVVHNRPLSSPAVHSHVPLPAFHPPSGPAPNAWATKPDPPTTDPPTSTMLSGSRILHASAIEKVSSGRWHSKPPPPDVEVIRFHEPESLIENVRIEERVVPPVYSEVKERARSPMYSEAKGRNMVSFNPNGTRPSSSDGRLGVPQSPRQGSAHVWEHPKLKLLPKTKLQEPPESWVLDDKQGSQTPLDNVHVENAHQIHGVMNVQKPGSTETDAGGRAVERPRLNLKPRSLPVEQSVESTQRERKTVFGGARPRELVLKERGIDNFDVNSFDVPSPTNRVRSDMVKTDFKIDPAAPAIVYGERADTTLEHRSRPDLERDYRPNTDKWDAQSAPDNRRNSKEIKKPTEPRRQEPETWRKLVVEQPKLDGVPGTRFGKATSALELAQAFSRPVSDPRITNQSLPGRNQVPFSRLTDTREFYSGPAQRRINGY